MDFVSADRFDLSFISHVGKPQRPWIIHRAPLGSHERFVALLLEYYDGQLPGWLCPIQLFVIPLVDEQRDEAQKLVHELGASGIRVKLDESQGSLSKRILYAHRFRPFAKLILGPKELGSQRFKIQLRDRDIEVDRGELVGEMQGLLAVRRP